MGTLKIDARRSVSPRVVETRRVLMEYSNEAEINIYQDGTAEINWYAVYPDGNRVFEHTTPRTGINELMEKTPALYNQLRNMIGEINERLV